MRFSQQGSTDMQGSSCPLATEKDTATWNAGWELILRNPERAPERLGAAALALSPWMLLLISPDKHCRGVWGCWSRRALALAFPRHSSARPRLGQPRSAASQLHRAQEGLLPSTHAPAAADCTPRAVLTAFPELPFPRTAEDEQWSVFLRRNNLPQLFFFFFFIFKWGASE